jgi:outer membrane receptor for ferric coprogen and ferric-rhodotorulic acid
MSRLTLRPGLLAVAVALSIGGQPLPSFAEETAPSARSITRSYDIPAGPLGETLARISRESGRTLSADPALLQGRNAPAVRGDYSPEQAAQLALAGSGLRLLVTVSGTLSVQPGNDSGALELGTLSVVGSGLGETTEGTGSYTTGSTRTATKMAMSLRETPQSVTVVTRQKMDDQNVQSLDDVARTTTGITYSKVGTERSTYYSRGFEINDLQFDGLPSNISESYSMDALSISNMAIYDRIEVVRGANGLMQGTGNPSAAINLVRKRPTRDFHLGAELGAGSWDGYRSQVDVSGPLSEDGRFRGRAVGFYSTANSYRDGAEKDNQLLYVIGEADLDDSTVFSIGATVQQDNNNGYDWGGLNTRADGSFYPLSRSTSLNGTWAYLDRTNYNLFSDLTHVFDNDWTLTLASNSIWSDAGFLSSYPSRTSGDNFNLLVSKADYEDRQLGLDLYATGPFQLFGREHQLMFGANQRKDEFDVITRSATNTANVNIGDFDYSTLPTPIINYGARSDANYVRRDRSLYAATRLSATDKLSVILGARVNWSGYDVRSLYLNDDFRENRRLIPYAGLVYDLDANHTLYASYTEIYRMQNVYGSGGTPLKPQEGENYELGIKSEYFDGRLNASLALFQTDLLNMPEATAGPRTCGVTGTSTCYREGGKVRNRGFEIELSGMPLEGWNLSAGYTYSDPEYVAGASKGNDYNPRIPRRLLKFSSDYRLPGTLQQWRLGGDVYSQSRMSYSGSTFDIVQSGYTLLNLHANYQINRQFSLQYNLNNALDRKYYQSIPTNNNWGGLLYGDPRNFAVTLRYQY